MYVHCIPDQHNDELSNGTQKKRTGRGVTKKEDIFSRTPDMPKINILLNERGQPVGKNARQLSSFIGCQVRKKLPLTSVDWRLVPAVKKCDLWTELKVVHCSILYLLQFCNLMIHILLA